MRLLFIGDIVGKPGRSKVCQHLARIKEDVGVFFTIAQGENLAGGIGVTDKTAQELLDAGVDCITTGNHVWKHKDIYAYLDKERRILRPANYPEGVPGQGSAVYEKEGVTIGVLNLEGRVFMRALRDPFAIGKECCERLLEQTKNVFVDIHAEATSEKKALALYLAEYATAVIGTHTHVQTADEQRINAKTAYITDVGMAGSTDSVIGLVKDDIIRYYLLSIPQKFKVAKENIVVNCVVVDFNEKTGTARSITRLNF
jgi:metallophosphoesterase (TIGR00282 family)